jgi:hypothetical protein
MDNYKVGFEGQLKPACLGEQYANRERILLNALIAKNLKKVKVNANG